MADDIELDAGSGGDTIAADDISGVKYGRTKITLGADGVNDGDVASGNPMPVGVISALPAGTNAIGKLAANSGVDIGDVDVTSVAPGTSASSLGKAEDAAHGSGDVGVMSLAVRTDSPANKSGADGDYEPLQVSAGRLWCSVVVDTALPAGTNAIGKLAANDGVDIGDVSLNNSFAAVTGGGVESGALRVTIASDSTGVVSIDDNGGAITVDGTVAATQSGTWNITNVSGTVSLPTGASTAAKQPALGTAGSASSDVISVQGIASMTPLLVNATGSGDVPITLAGEAVVLGAGSAAIGKLVANSGVDIGDVDVTSVTPGTSASNLGKAEDAAHSSGDVGVMALAVRDDALGAASGTDGDYEPLHTNASGALYTQDSPNTTGGLTPYRNIDVDESEDEVKGSAGQVYWIHAMNLASGVRYLHFYNDTAANVTVGSTTPTLTIPLPTQGDTNGAGFTINIDKGLAFSAAITVAATTTATGADAPGANEVFLSLGYK